jgi:alkylation response protein AidB-like acyl-CoA dehydrogenase
MRALLGDSYPHAHERLERMGRLAAGPVDRLAMLADQNPPRLQNWDRDGYRIDEVRFHESYEDLRRIAYGEGIIAGAYQNTGRDPKSLTFGLGLLFAMGEQGLYCPICMTDGAARVLERFAPRELAALYVPRLGAKLSPLEGAMWLTERQGGSDVGSNVTIAREAENGEWRLTGEKFFCSNLGAEVALVLARPDGAPAGTHGLALFLVPAHLQDGKRNPGLRYRRLKDKLGTRSMPTGEVELKGAHASLIAPPGPGFKAMAEMLNLSRLYNAVASCAIMRRAWHEAAAHAARRAAFGRRLEEHPLHQEVLASLVVECEASTALVFESIRRLDRIDSGSTDPDDRSIHRALTPLVKMHTGKRAVAAASEAIEALGGIGYIEERVTARLLRDAQVLPIWEGTTSILALDFLLRSLAKEGGLDALARFGEALLSEATDPDLAAGRAVAERALAAARASATAAIALGPEEGSRAARAVATAWAHALEGALLLSEAQRDLAERGDARAALLALRHLGQAPALDARRYRAIAGCEPIPRGEAGLGGR